MLPSARLVAGLLFGSGLTALIYQTAWQRMFRLIFGSSTAASAAVLGIFLGGLGLGGLWLGARAERHERPLLLYGNIEVCVALAAALTPLSIELGSLAYVGLGGTSRLGLVLATVLRLVIAVLVMGPAVVLMGGTLPAAARAFEQEGDSARRRLALLYALNTLGAVVGALLGTFVLFELLGTRLSLWAAALINLLVALAARQAGRSAPALTATASGAPHATASASHAPGAPPALVYAALACVGFAFLCLELVWYRMLGPILGGSSFTFGIILAVALAGIGGGGYLYSRRDAARPASFGLLALTLVLEALAIGIPFALGDSLALYTAYTRSLAALGFGALVLSWLVTASVVVLPAALVAGYQFPVLFALLGQGRERVARQVGLAYAFNTLGSIAGAIAGGFVLLPTVGAVGTWRGVVVLLALLGLCACGYQLLRQPRRLGAVPALLAGALALLCASAEGPGAVWRHSAIGAGRFNIAQMDKNQLTAERLDTEKRLLWERDGIESSVALSADQGLSFWVNGKNDGSVVGDRGTQAMLALAAAALHPKPESVFVLGLGTGMSAGWVASVPGVERVDVAELEPAVLEVARAARQANQAVLERPNVHVLRGDGRELLLTGSQRYDIIASEPSNPYRAGVASLFTAEFYAAAAGKLNEGGLFAQWLQGYEVDVATLRTVLRTLRSALPFVEIWQTQSDDLLLLASREARAYDAVSLRERLAREPFRSALPRMWLTEGVEGLLSHFVASAALAARLGEALAPALNTDDDTVLEYAFARQVGNDTDSLSKKLYELSAQLHEDRPEIVGALDWERTHELRGRAWLVSLSNVPRLPGLSEPAELRLRALERACLRQQYDFALKAFAPSTPALPLPALDLLESFALASGLAMSGDRTALEIAGKLAAEGFEAEAHLIRARLFLALRERPAALHELILALDALRQGPLPLCEVPAEVLNMIKPVVQNDAALARQALSALLQGPLSVYMREALRRQVAQDLAFALGDPALCVKALGQDLAEPRWRREFLTQRMVCLQRARHPLAEQAAADLTRFLENTSGDARDGVVGDGDGERLAR